MNHLTLATPTTQLNLPSGETAHYFGAHFPSTIHSYKDAQNKALWNHFYQPFAAVLASADGEFMLVRDHIGMEPLYYCLSSSKLIVGQSIPEILALLPSRPRLRETQVHALFNETKRYADETLYQGIYRVAPGHRVRIKASGAVEKDAFWTLDPFAPKLRYKHVNEYCEQYNALMHEAMLNACENQEAIAGEFSAGLDSSAVYCAALNANLKPQLYMHTAAANSPAEKQYDTKFEKKLVEQLQLNDIQRINADDFDPIAVFNEYSSWFSGPPPYIFPLFSNPLHKAVSNAKHRILLSGFGGDQCVSGQVTTNFFIPELIYQGQYKKAFNELKGGSKLKAMLRFAQYMHPSLYQQRLNLKKAKQRLSNFFSNKENYRPPILHPYEYIYYPSLSEVEAALVQGLHSHEVHSRVEYSALIGKKMGFSYRYPLLYPKLLEFMLSVPTEYKRFDGRGRYFIRKYLHTALGDNYFDTYRKQDGLGIMPSAFHRFEEKYINGDYYELFKDLPYAHLIRNKAQAIEMRNAIKGFMLRGVV